MIFQTFNHSYMTNDFRPTKSIRIFHPYQLSLYEADNWNYNFYEVPTMVLHSVFDYDLDLCPFDPEINMNLFLPLSIIVASIILFTL